MINSQILPIVLKISTLLGFLSLIAYLSFIIFQKILEKEARSIRETIEGEDLFNANQILQILQQFEEESPRLEALKLLTGYGENRVKILLKDANKLNFIELKKNSANNLKKIALIFTSLFLILALISLIDSTIKNCGYTGSCYIELERTYRFSGPFKVARDGDRIVFNLTEAIQDKQLSNKELQVEKVTATGKVINESNESFAFDQELLIFSKLHPPRSPLIDTRNPQQFSEIHNGYAPPRRLLQLTLRTDDGRDVNSKNPIQWSVDLPEVSATNGEIRSLKNSQIMIDNDGLFVQLFLWTLWGGNHSIEFRDFEIKIIFRLFQKSFFDYFFQN